MKDILKIEHRYVRTNGIQLHVVFAGPEEGTPVVLLHGFPEFWYGWRHQMAFLARQGYRVIVPDQRGYNLSDKPKGRDAYRIELLAQDIVGLIEALGYQKVFLAGHDWGAAVAWWLVTYHAQSLRKLAILNVPHPAVLGLAVQQRNWRQFLKSWYIYFFQLPWLPEWTIKKSGAQSLHRSGHPTTFTDQDIAVYQTAWLQPGALTGMINWYRAALFKFALSGMPEAGSIQVPTLILWGEQDIALGKELVQPSLDLCDNGQLVFFPNATHWLQHDEVDEVNEHLLAFFK